MTIVDAAPALPAANISRATSGTHHEGLRRFLAQMQRGRATGAASTESGLGALACKQVCVNLGFSKAMYSRVTGPWWAPESVYVRPEIDTGFDELRNAVDGSTVPLLRAPLEADLVRSRRPYTLARPTFHRDAYRPLIDLSDPAAYAAAPVVADGRTVAILHVDRDDEAINEDHVNTLLLVTRLLGIMLTTEGNRRRYAERQSQLTNLLGVAADENPDRNPPFRRDSLLSADIDIDDVEATPQQAGLTAREYEVLTLLAEGLTNREIATQLYVSEGTVKSHVRRIFHKIDVRSRAQAAAAFSRISSGLEMPTINR